MRKPIKYRERKLNILISQIELEYHKTIIYHLCNECHDPILLNDIMHVNGEQCHKCKKWYCTKNYIGDDEYYNSCCYKLLLSLFATLNPEDSENASIICKSCLMELVKNSNCCEHVKNIINNKRKSENLSIIYKDNKYYCEEC